MTIEELIAEGQILQTSKLKSAKDNTMYHTWTNNCMTYIYGVETLRLNEQVKRNINRFPEDIMFQLTKNEFELLKSQIAISKSVESQKDNVLISQIVTSKPEVSKLLK